MTRGRLKVTGSRVLIFSEQNNYDFQHQYAVNAQKDARNPKP
jgi:hypothetical protein